jgi:hypothetical protein
MNDVQKFSYIVGKTVGYFPDEVANALVENGVVLDAKNYSLTQLTNATVDGLKSSPKFFKAFSELADAKELEFGYLESEFNFSGEGNFYNSTGSTRSYATNLATTTTTAPASSTSSTSSWGKSDYIGIGTTLLNSTISIWGTSKSTDAAKAESAAQAKKAEIDLQIAQTNSQTEKDKLIFERDKLALMLNQPASKSNLPLYIGLGIGGVVILGLVVFLIVRGSGSNQNNQAN